MEEVSEYRHHGARLVDRQNAQWLGVRAELITREADGPCEAAMCVRQHVVSLLVDGDRAGFLNRIADGPLRRVARDPGWIRVLPAGRMVRSRWEQGRRTYLMAFVDPDWLSASAARGGAEARFDPAEQLDLRDERLGRVLGDMRDELRAPGLCSVALGEALAATLAVRLLRAAPSVAAPARGGLSPHSLRAVLALIEQQAAGPLTLRALAAEAGVSLHHFSHAFRQSTGMPPHRYLLTKRLDAARVLLNDPALPLTEVAARAGFGSPSQFAMAFRRAHGMSPSEWRRSF